MIKAAPEQLIIHGAITSDEFLSRLSAVDPLPLIDNKPLKTIISLCLEFHQAHKAAPNGHFTQLLDAYRERYEEDDARLDIMDRAVETALDPMTGPFNVEFAWTAAVEYLRHKKLDRLCKDLRNALNASDHDQAEATISGYVPLGTRADGAVVTTLAEVVPERIRWLWPGRVAQGKLSLLIGEPGLGKSSVTLDIAARLTTGAAWPDGGTAPSGDAVILTAEDGLADTIRPRLDAMHANASRVHAITAIRHRTRERSLDLTRDLPHLERVVDGTNAKLLIIDPLSAYLGRANSFQDAEVRGVLAPLAALAERSGVAVLGVMHLNKDKQKTALHRAQGSIAFVGAARAVFAVTEDPDSPTWRLLLSVKNNLSEKAPGLRFRLRPVEDSVRVCWSAKPVDADPDQMLSEDPQARGQRQEVTDFLRDLLSHGRVSAREVERALKANGIPVTPWVLMQARKSLGVNVTKTGFKSGWEWSLPQDREGGA